MSSNKGKESSLAYGGQALIEGVMMRDRKHMVLVVRKPNNEILTNIEDLSLAADKFRFLGVPFIRGIVALFESFILGMKGILFSANAALSEEDEEESITLGYKELILVGLGALGIVSIFFVAPFLLAEYLNLTGIVFNIAEALIRLLMFVLYLVLISSWGEFRRVLQYHGAEHKAINAHEAGVSLEIEKVKEFPRYHPRCGTSFLFIVLIISIIVFSLLPSTDFTIRLASRLLLIPVIAGISYELLKLSGKYQNSIVMRILTAPGLAFQLLTTKEPSDDMLEVSVKAVQEITKLSNV
ncbi:MAG: hypothetical protein AC479_04205 [miscellaneous Crenarchaeota group-6 archaeon AD8-1]|nr:MAG: hypothetical protein AC479_04205 [miscellaneous Crenarchaeota group-6 archaeon AD8-1]